ncbi:hypothetical protein NQ314_005723 [Rhamnusium bicolor]|uniref:CCHC-type domain-containing protein n=1 Tax=Rhamnusium bicolor TaxID=1586634 RepID=A0AAV8ZFW0_9CUCU|nr:hypothetical protein NQ314_005723 [Rhamnusium bicolor]
MNPTTNITSTTTTVDGTTAITDPIVTTASAGGLPGPSQNLGAVPRAPAMYSLGMIASTIENFNGRDVVRYLEKLEQRARLDGWTEDETLRLLKFKCVGEAYDFLKSDASLDGLNFWALKARLIANFGISRLPGDNQLNLSRCYQRHDESISAYCTRLRILGARVLEEDLSNATIEEQAGIRKKNRDLVLNQFKMGLRKEIMKEVGVLLLREDQLTLDKAEELVKLHETTMRMIQGKHTGQRMLQVNCYSCGEVGHISRNCTRQQNTQRYAERGACFLCHQHGHWARECPNGNNGNNGNKRPWNGSAQRREERNNRERYGGSSGKTDAYRADRNKPQNKYGSGAGDENRERWNRTNYGNQPRSVENEYKWKNTRRETGGNRQEQPKYYTKMEERADRVVGRRNMDTMPRTAKNEVSKDNSTMGTPESQKNYYIMGKRKIVSVIPTLSTVEEGTDMPYIISLRLNGKTRGCLVDTGAAVSLMKYRTAMEESLRLEECTETTLTGITGHPLNTYGIVHVNLETPITKTKVGGDFIVCEDEIFGSQTEVDILLGRDFLAAHNVVISCGLVPAVEICGEYVLEGSSGSLAGQDIEEPVEVVLAAQLPAATKNTPTNPKRGVLTDMDEREVEKESHWESWLQEVDNFYKGVGNKKNQMTKKNQITVDAQVHCSVDGIKDANNKEKVARNLKVLEEIKEVRQPEIKDLQDRVESLENALVELMEKLSTVRGDEPSKRCKRKKIKGPGESTDRMETGILSVEKVIVPPRIEVMCLGRLKRQLNGEVLVCKPVEIGNKEAHVARAVIGKKDIIPVRIINVSRKEVTIRKGQKIGTAISGKEAPEIEEKNKTICQIDVSNDKWIEDFNLSHFDAGTKTEKVKGTRITRFNKKTERRTFGQGDLVYMKDVSAEQELSRKLVKPWKGPYRVIDVVGPVTYKIRKVGSREEQVVHINRLKKFYQRESISSEDDTESDEEKNDQEEMNVDENTQQTWKPVFPQWVEVYNNTEEDIETVQDVIREGDDTVGDDEIFTAEIQYAIGVIINGLHLYQTVGGGIALLACIWNTLTMWVIHRHQSVNNPLRKDTKTVSEGLKTVVSDGRDKSEKDYTDQVRVYPNLSTEPHWTEAELAIVLGAGQ